MSTKAAAAAMPAISNPAFSDFGLAANPYSHPSISKSLSGMHYFKIRLGLLPQ
jgi:hypothetical protein